MSQVNLSTVSPIPVFNQMWPADCPKSLQLLLNMNAASPGGADQWDLNTVILNQKDFIEGVQSCYYDNSENNTNVIFECPDTGFRTFFRARWQGYRPLIVAKNQLTGRFTTVTGTGMFRINLMNTPVQPIEWLAV